MKKIFTLALISIFLQSVDARNEFLFFPENGATNVNPDTHLTITFQEAPALTAKGIIRIFDAHTNILVDQLDMSIPAGPTEPDLVRKQRAIYTPVPYIYETTHFTNANTVPGTPSGAAMRDTSNYQLTIIGRFTDGFHFHPVIIKGNTAVIYPHNNLLEYGKEYYVTIDKEVFATETGDFQGVQPQTWKFGTKTKEIEKNIRHLVVSNDGAGDFNTVQGAMDFIPDFSNEKWEVLIKNGDYEELVYFRNKCNVTLKGESRDGVVVHYGNNETFNPHPVNIKTNEWPGTFPSRRGAFTADNCYDLRFENFTVMTTLVGQAEGLLLMGARNYLKNVHIIGSGDALQINGSVYLDECVIDGGGDTVLGRGPAFFYNCIITSSGPFAWIRNTEANHGDVFVNCTFLGKISGPRGGLGNVFARAPINNGVEYPYAEAVLINCRMDNILPEGWKQISNATNHFWEYNSRSIAGQPIDVSHRHPLSRQLDREKDAKLIQDYSDAEFVLGWNPFSNTVTSLRGRSPKQTR
jgi:pectin methylesterase-like acyl-CoA thioesterase